MSKGSTQHPMSGLRDSFNTSFDRIFGDKIKLVCPKCKSSIFVKSGEQAICDKDNSEMVEE